MQMWRRDTWTRRGKERVGQIARVAVRILPCVKQIAGGKLLYSLVSSAQCSDDLDEWDGGEAQEEEDIFIGMADCSHYCTTESNRTL